jgi:hypothetical protein
VFTRALALGANFEDLGGSPNIRPCGCVHRKGTNPDRLDEVRRLAARQRQVLPVEPGRSVHSGADGQQTDIERPTACEFAANRSCNGNAVQWETLANLIGIQHADDLELGLHPRELESCVGGRLPLAAVEHGDALGSLLHQDGAPVAKAYFE